MPPLILDRRQLSARQAPTRSGSCLPTAVAFYGSSEIEAHTLAAVGGSWRWGGGWWQGGDCRCGGGGAVCAISGFDLGRAMAIFGEGGVEGVISLGNFLFFLWEALMHGMMAIRWNLESAASDRSDFLLSIGLRYIVFTIQ